jgi:CheY-like chemotaxis protein
MPTPAPRSSARLLMVDDNSLGLQARKAVLEELGHKVTTAGSAEDALEQLAAHSHTFDIVITDYKLPAMNGRELIRKIQERQMQVFTVLLSGFVDALGLSEANTGADVVLQKSSQEVSHLARSVKALLRKRKAPGSDPGDGTPGGTPSRRQA